MELNSWRPHSSLERERKIRHRLFTSSLKLAIRHFHVVVMQWQQRNGKKWRTAPPKNCRPTVGRQSANCWLTVVYRILRKSSANSRPTVGRLSADCWLTVGSMSVICWQSVGWEPLSNTRKASPCREEHCISTRNETFSLESAILYRFFRYQTPHNPITSSSQSILIISNRTVRVEWLQCHYTCQIFKCQFAVGQLSVNCWHTAGWQLADSIPTVGQQTFRGAVLHFYQEMYKKAWSMCKFVVLLNKPIAFFKCSRCCHASVVAKAPY